MTNQNHIQILREGVDAWNQWRRDNPDLVPDLRGVDLRGANLHDANLRGADLRDANLTGTTLRGVDLRGADLRSEAPDNKRPASIVISGIEPKELFQEFFRNGKDLRSVNLSGANLHDANLIGADLSGANLHDANLHGVNLSGANLHDANLHGVNLSGVYLNGIRLGSADLSNADLSAADLRDADLKSADLRNANLSGAYFSGADLSSADLRNTDFRNACLCGSTINSTNFNNANLGSICLEDTTILDSYFIEANLANADLMRSRFIGCNLSDAVVENACVTDIDVQRLHGLPRPPEQLRIWGSAEEVLLTGLEAREFFHLPAIVEVYVTRELNQQEFGCYHFHLGEMHHKGVATGVYFIGHRHENGGSVLRFQANSYEPIYRVLPDLLAPFRMAGAVDWQQTIQAIPEDDREEAILALAALELRPAVVAWHFARRMAEAFDGCRNARIQYISEWGKSRRIYIEIVENPEEVQRLADMMLPEPWDGKGTLMITQGQNATLSIVGRGNMGDRTEIHGDAIGSTVGSGTVTARDITVYKNVVDSSSRLGNDIKRKLKEAREAIETLGLSDADKADVIDDLNKLTAELDKPEQDNSRVQRYWSRIKEVAPTVASILASAASLAKLFGGA